MAIDNLKLLEEQIKHLKSYLICMVEKRNGDFLNQQVQEVSNKLDAKILSYMKLNEENKIIS